MIGQTVIATRIATLNTRHGGTRSAEALATRLLGYDADLLVVTEFRNNDAGTRLLGRLEAAGYATTHPNTEPNQNTVLIASRHAINKPGLFVSERLVSSPRNGAAPSGASHATLQPPLPSSIMLVRLPIDR